MTDQAAQCFDGRAIVELASWRGSFSISVDQKSILDQVASSDFETDWGTRGVAARAPAASMQTHMPAEAFRRPGAEQE